MSQIRYQLLNSRQGPQLKEFIQQVYGDDYPSEMFYDPGKIALLIDQNRLVSSIAMDGDRIIGHLASYLEHADDISADGVTGMVLPEYRGQNIMTQLAAPMMSFYEQKQLAGLHLYALTLHSISQRKILKNGGIVTGLLLADWPGNYRVQGFASPGDYRMPAVMLFFPFYKDSIPERTIYPPQRYQKQLASMYQQLEISRQFATADSNTPAILSRFHFIDKPKQGVATLRFLQIGKDWGMQVHGFEARFGQNRELYLDIPLGDRCCPQAVEELTRGRWYYGGLLVERNHTDYLRLQCSPVDQHWAEAELTTPARAILDFILADSATG